MANTPVSLLDRLRNPTDAAAWERWMVLYRPILGRWLRRTDLQRADVDNVIQEVLLTVLRELPRFQHNGHAGAFRKWLQWIVRHRVRDFLRKPKPVAGGSWERVLADLESPQSAMSRWWEREHDLFVLRRLLDLLESEFEPTTWKAFCLQVLDNEPTAKVAEELHITENAARIAKCRVMQRLKQEGRDLVT